jgi:hypothetical protein
MQREQVRQSDGDAGATHSDRPTLVIQFDGSSDHLYEELTARLRENTSAEDIEVSFRFLGDGDDAETGVLALTDRVTGDYILECDGDPRTIQELIRAVREDTEYIDESAQYTVQIRSTTDRLTHFAKELLLVYDADGTLLRHRSLIPSDIEI